jgi:hypothetical protein
VTGPFPAVKGLSYRASANYSFADQGPYVIGPTQSGDTSGARDAATGELVVLHRPPERIPIDRFRSGVGLQYDF